MMKLWTVEQMTKLLTSVTREPDPDFVEWLVEQLNKGGDFEPDTLTTVDIRRVVKAFKAGKARG